MRLAIYDEGTGYYTATVHAITDETFHYPMNDYVVLDGSALNHSVRYGFEWFEDFMIENTDGPKPVMITLDDGLNLYLSADHKKHASSDDISEPYQPYFRELIALFLAQNPDCSVFVMDAEE